MYFAGYPISATVVQHFRNCYKQPVCHSAAHYLSFRSEAEESAFSRCSMVYTFA
jgi:hypothetical protein